MADIAARLRRLGPTIERLMTIGGTPGVSIGVITKGHPDFYGNFGLRDVEKKLPVTEDTIFPICSLTKAFTAAAMGLLVEEKKLKWDSLVKDVLPAFQSISPLLQDHLTITDILSHRSGLGYADNLILGSDGNILLGSRDMMKFINHRELLGSFRAELGYNNLNYELAGRVIEHVSGQSYFDFVQNRLIEPLKMERTFLKTPPKSTADVTVSYNALDDASATPINFYGIGDDWYGGPSGAVRSSATDLLKFYRQYLQGFNDQISTGTTSSDGVILKQLSHVMTSKITMDQPTKNEASYGFGWARAQLPGRTGQIGINPGLLPNGMPFLGKGRSSLLLFHQGSLPGSLTYVGLLPDIEAAVVVLTNSLALNDVADWVGQVIIEELLDVETDLRNDFVSFAESAVTENLKWYPTIIEELAKHRKTGTHPKPLDQYVGTYWDDQHIVKIQVALEGDKLFWLIQGLENEKFPLQHYQDDTFTWLLPRNELSKRGRWVGADQDATFWKVIFRSDESDKITSLSWTHDVGVPAVTYTKV